MDIFTGRDGFQLMGGAPLVSASYSSLSAAALRPTLRVIFLHQMTTGELLGSIMRTLLWPKFHCSRVGCNCNAVGKFYS